MKTSPAGRIFIKQFEKLKLTSYKDPLGIWTIGWGHTKGVTEGNEINLETAELFFDQDLQGPENTLNQTGILFLQDEYDALVSFIFNVGSKAFRTSTLYKYLYAKQFGLAAEEFKRWNKGRNKAGEMIELPGLTKRRLAERKLFLEGKYD